MTENVATNRLHESLAIEVRALVELVATSTFDASAIEAALPAIVDLRTRLSRTALDVPTTNERAIPRWPVERSAVSGPLNPFAPPLLVEEEGDELVGTMTYPRALQGPPEHAHGGHVAMVFDHLAGRVAARAGKPIVTGRLAVRYLRPTPVRVPIRFTAKLVESRHSLVTVRCEAHAGTTKTATAEITFVELSASHFEQVFGNAKSGEN